MDGSNRSLWRSQPSNETASDYRAGEFACRCRMVFRYQWLLDRCQLGPQQDAFRILSPQRAANFTGVLVCTSIHRHLGYHRNKTAPGHLPALSHYMECLLYTSDAADDLLCVDLGGRRIIKKKK